MEHYVISKLLNDSTVSKFVTKNWNQVNDLLSGQYSADKNISFKISMLRSNLCKAIHILLWKEEQLLQVLIMLIEETNSYR